MSEHHVCVRDASINVECMCAKTKYIVIGFYLVLDVCEEASVSVRTGCYKGMFTFVK